MERIEIAVIGNGIIGTLAAWKLSEAGFRVALVGKAGRPDSASMAAGAMLNVLGEVDAELDDYGRRKLAIGERALGLWRNLLPPEIYVADKTHIYRRDGGTALEGKAFAAIAAAAKSRPERQTDRDICVLPDEPAVSTPALFAWLDAKLRGRNVPILETVPKADKFVQCSGAFTKVPGALPLYFGVGNAMTVRDIKLDIPARTVMRTPNRGNTCGLHIVPRGDCYYVGAGSYIATGPSEGYRIETLRYLIACLESDFGVDTWQASIQPIKGYRPVALDGKPMLGPMRDNPSVYVATGTKRDGLTYAPVIAEDIIAWATNGPRSAFAGWEPDRAPISFGPREYAIEMYIENRLAALHEHGRDAKVDDVRRDAEAAYKRGHEHFKVPATFGFHPEMLHVI